MNSNIGFMQGRFSPLIDGMIQAFPAPYWQSEFKEAHRCGFELMEWTLDAKGLYDNPLLTPSGRSEIRRLMKHFNISIPSLTGDCFMQKPFYKCTGSDRRKLIGDLVNVIESCAELGLENILMPLVDHGRIENKEQEESLLDGLSAIHSVLSSTGLTISFESDYSPHVLAAFVESLDSKCFGITYDMGNSAALGYDFNHEFDLYGTRIVNVHVKDRKFKGETVPLGNGNAKIPEILRALKKIGYSGNYILQTARSKAGDHSRVLCNYRDKLLKWLEEAKD